MEYQDVCRFDYKGFCKYGDHCGKHHFSEICQNKSCRSFSCQKRHPNVCFFFANFRSCKFGEYCRYFHERVKPVEVHFRSKFKELKELEEQVKKLKTEVESKTKALTKETINTEKIKEKVTLLEEENKKLQLKMKENTHAYNSKRNNDTKILTEQICALEKINRKLFIENEPYKHSLSGGRINMNNVKKDYQKVREENEDLTKEVTDLKERNAKIFEVLREQTKKWGECEHEIMLLKKRLGEYESESESESE